MGHIVFGTDGWRARIAEDFTFANVRRVAWALGRYLKGTAAVLIGFDRRFGSAEFASAAASVLAGMGCPVRLANAPLPTPSLSLLARKHKAWALVVTASHNPPFDNGLKIKTPDGAPAPQAVTSAVESLIAQAPETFPSAHCLGDPHLRREYIAILKRLSRGLAAKLGSKKIVVDYFHGSGSGYLEEVLGQHSIVALRRERDPYFGGVAPEPVEKNLTELKKRVLQERAFLGVALDGDGDRLSVVDEKGRYLAPTLVFPLFAYYYALVSRKRGEIVQGVSLGYLGERIAKAAGLPFQWVPVGFKHIAERVVSNHVLVGGEESGGYCLAEILPDRDGTINTILLVKILLELKMTPSLLVKKICSEFGDSHYLRQDLHLERPVDKTKLKEAALRELVPLLERHNFRPAKEITIDGLKLFFEDGSWILMRPSGTEPLIRLYAETPKPAATKKLIETMSRWTTQYVKREA